MRLKEFDYNIEIGFNEARKLNEVIGIADNQILRSIRDITNKNIDYKKLEELYTERDLLIKSKNNSKNKKTITDIQNKIYDITFIPEYIAIYCEHPSHYDYMCENGVYINGYIYKRFSCPSGKARNSTAIFIISDIFDELERRIDNNRDKSKKIAPSKFNAYFGLASSATKLVTEPKFIVVKDFENTATFKAHHVIEVEDKDLDDIVETKDVTISMNRTDGIGLIKKEMADIWAMDMGLDYTPSQFCIRQSYIKGLLCVFPIEDFCEKINNGNYIVDTIYKDDTGEYIKADLREYDVILTESQFKLWNSYKNLDNYINYCHQNKLYWGVSQYSRKQDKNILRMNYQFIQTLNLNNKNIEKLCDKFVDWVNGVSYDNFYYMLLFLLGINNTEDSIKNFLSSSQQYWLKSLVICPELKNDKYICKKIRDLIRIKIHNACLGEIFVDGNFQPLVSDPYGFMQHVCGLEVTGLLKENEFYSNYWNKKNVKLVDSMRSPLTFRSEHVLLNLRNDKEINYWYRYCTSGIIVNYHGHETVNWGGADFDFDIISTTSNKEIIKGVYTDELPMHYDAPKPKPIIFTRKDLTQSDKFSFGSIIGQITNKSSNAYALLPKLEEKYGKDSREYKITYERLIQCCKAQSCQIDKTKIGKEVKGIPKIWNEHFYEPKGLAESQSEKEERKFYNSILINKRPYFFRYRYKECKNNYNKYVDENNITCKQKFGVTLDKLLSAKRHTKEEKEFIKNFDEYMPVTDSNSPMNLLCKYIEGINFDISNKIKSTDIGISVEYLRNNKITYDSDERRQIINVLFDYLESNRSVKIANSNNKSEEDEKKDIDISVLIDGLFSVCPDIDKITNCLIDYYYTENRRSNKDILWMSMGKYIFSNIKRNLNIKTVLFPLPNENGSIEYLGNNYELVEVDIN